MFSELVFVGKEYLWFQCFLRKHDEMPPVRDGSEVGEILTTVHQESEVTETTYTKWYWRRGPGRNGLGVVVSGNDRMCKGTRGYGKELDNTGLTEERSGGREQDKGKERQIIISTRERIKTQSGILLSVWALPDRGCAYWVFRFRGERASSGLVDGIRDVSGSSGMVRCVWEWCSPLRECLLSKRRCSIPLGMLQMSSGML